MSEISLLSKNILEPLSCNLSGHSKIKLLEPRIYKVLNRNQK